ncbi:sugar phosphate isomerase/epimerase [Candidatus Poribacteria bacterium]|jgi:3-oxoisoapionate decarboxylase|nr:sugar phosphate isomerase/epimerase [Candidatus Poribacteria bacterium]MBT5534892.1 sugar phosphate isomerase/epimerase [Candidatus Poribacteria bacterium]MBT5715142.1 sugar phosphate isomerase/epimerase [Candidatus Poribacteria bacterium]MBT7098857.1 sugar phosphate isomerase/epimerase [Candidatus Poribacteria bacterium]MBT7807397.1 sugar phosphate isomerase/epimerase [Candidatus Poribacteria bacterium]
MEVGLDHIPLLGYFKWDVIEFMEHAAEYGYEGVQIPSGQVVADTDYRRRVADKAVELGLYLEIGGAGIDAARSGKSPAELAEAWRPLFDVAADLGARVLITGLGTWPWEGRVSEEPGHSPADQIDGGIAALRAIAPIAADHDMLVSVHTAFFTAAEYVRLMEEVDSAHAGLCLDTGNAFLVLEDPTDFARAVAPWVNSTHLKDSAVYLTDAGMGWFGGSVLGDGTVDIPTIVGILHDANPDIALTVEDHWGQSSVPIYDAAFLSSLPPAPGDTRAKFLKHLQLARAHLDAGRLPSKAEVETWDLGTVLPDRARANAAYAKDLRDSL